MRTLRYKQKHGASYFPILLSANGTQRREKSLNKQVTSSHQIQDIDTVLKFVGKRLETAQKSHKTQPTKEQSSSISTSAVTHNKVASNQCELCNHPHRSLFHCTKFGKMTIEERCKYVKEKNICKNCLRKHEQPCKSFYRCSKCKQEHNTILHMEKKANSTGTLTAIASSSSTAKYATEGLKLLPTAIIKIPNAHGAIFTCRALMDTGSQTSLITENTANCLNYFNKHNKYPPSTISNNDNLSSYLLKC